MRLAANDGNRTSPVSKEIEETLIDDPSSFHEFNLGVTEIVDAVKFNPSTGVLTLEFSNPTFLKEYKELPLDPTQIRGLANGGTTCGTINAAIRDKKYPNKTTARDGEAFVKLTVHVGQFTRDEVCEMVTSLNSNLVVDPFTRANYANYFDPIRTFLELWNSGKKDLGWGEESTKDFPPVNYYYGDSVITGGPAAEGYQIQDLVQFLCLFSRTEQTGKYDPTKAYTGTSGCLSYYITEVSEDDAAIKATKARLREFRCMEYLDLLPGFVHLYEYIITELQSNYQRNVENGKFFGLKLFEDLALVDPRIMPFTHRPTNIRPKNSWVFPVLAAFRSLIDTESRNIAWEYNPEKVFDEVGGHGEGTQRAVH